MFEKIKNLAIPLTAILIYTGAILSLGVFIGCKSSVKIYNEKNTPQECNDAYTVMDYVKKLEGIFTTKNIQLWVTTINKQWDKCQDARIKAWNLRCKRWIFKDKKINKDKFPEYGYYLECKKRIPKKND